MFRSVRGFTLVELMITLVVVAIGVALALPTWQTAVEKRRLTAVAEEMVSLITFAQSEAVKRNQLTTFSWEGGGHNADWCMGVTLGAAACDCMQTNPAHAQFCDIDGQPYRLIQASFTNINDEFVHTNNNLTDSSLSFDPIRGIPTNFSANVENEIGSGDYLMYMHSPTKTDNKRNYEMQIRISMTGRVSLCTDDDRRSIVSGYEVCP